MAIRNFIKKLKFNWHHFALNATPSFDFLLWHLFDRDFQAIVASKNFFLTQKKKLKIRFFQQKKIFSKQT